MRRSGNIEGALTNLRQWHSLMGVASGSVSGGIVAGELAMLKSFVHLAIVAVSIAVVSLSVLGCGHSGHSFEWGEFSKIELGMNQSQVEAILGKPDSQEGGGNANGLPIDKILTWNCSDGSVITVILTEGKVRTKQHPPLMHL